MVLVFLFFKLRACLSLCRAPRKSHRFAQASLATPLIPVNVVSQHADASKIQQPSQGARVDVGIRTTIIALKLPHLTVLSVTGMSCVGVAMLAFVTVAGLGMTGATFLIRAVDRLMWIQRQVHVGDVEWRTKCGATLIYSATCMRFVTRCFWNPRGRAGVFASLACQVFLARPPPVDTYPADWSTGRGEILDGKA